jgi:hypothetical protein
MKDLDNDLSSEKRPIRQSWHALQKTGRFHIAKLGKVYFSDPKLDPIALQQLLGFTPDDYHAWLKRKRRQNCHTAYFEFLIWHRKQMMTPEQLDKFAQAFGW